MRWISHIAIAASVCAVFNPMAVPAAVLGSTAPDWAESIIGGMRRGRKPKHRGMTHYLVAWLLLALFAKVLWDWQGWLYWFALGGAIHWFCDSLTITGAPLSWWSDRRMSLFGGKVMTGSIHEYLITGVICLLCAIVIAYRPASIGGSGTGGSSGFVPFFFKHGELYEKGIIDGHEWRTHRFNFI
jgi:inner membrane protein